MFETVLLRKDEWSEYERPAKMFQEITEYSQRPCGNESFDRSKHAAKASKYPWAEMFTDVVIRKFKEAW